MALDTAPSDALLNTVPLLPRPGVREPVSASSLLLTCLSHAVAELATAYTAGYSRGYLLLVTTASPSQPGIKRQCVVGSAAAQAVIHA